MFLLLGLLVVTSGGGPTLCFCCLTCQPETVSNDLYLKDEDLVHYITPHFAYPSPVSENYFISGCSDGYLCNCE